MAEVNGVVESENPIPEGDATQTEALEEENILNQLIGDDAIDELSEATSVAELEGPKRKAKVEQEADNTVGAEPERKKHRTEQKGQAFRVSMVALNCLTETLQKLSGHMVSSRKGGEKIEQALTDTTCALSKVTQSLNLLHKQLEMNAEEERERRGGKERRREEERTKEREAEQPRTERYRDSEKKERAAIRKLLKEIKGDQEETPKMEKRKMIRRRKGRKISRR